MLGFRFGFIFFWLCFAFSLVLDSYTHTHTYTRSSAPLPSHSIPFPSPLLLHLPHLHFSFPIYGTPWLACFIKKEDRESMYVRRYMTTYIHNGPRQGLDSHAYLDQVIHVINPCISMYSIHPSIHQSSSSWEPGW
ncbi:hypothetical protein GGR50DRAFT_644553 [Xylaria sp. CBS 124048]|nr:hypothetical protein GGR50DRAFT_644553 [Xylaria sp. CBS 124048]